MNGEKMTCMEKLENITLKPDWSVCPNCGTAEGHNELIGHTHSITFIQHEYEQYVGTMDIFDWGFETRCSVCGHTSRLGKVVCNREHVGIMSKVEINQEILGE
jgi:hypothetical protein